MAEAKKPDPTAGGGWTFAVLLLMAPAICYGGWVFATIWNWFAFPFTPVRLTVPLAIGLSALITQIKGHYPGVVADRSALTSVILWLLLDSVALLVAWIAHLYVR